MAAKRLSAIREFTSFGSGFRIAMRDLEIRGAGNVLGTSQHGHMEAVGYEMYLKLLSEAVSEQRGENTVPQRGVPGGYPHRRPYPGRIYRQLVPTD